MVPGVAVRASFTGTPGGNPISVELAVSAFESVPERTGPVATAEVPRVVAAYALQAFLVISAQPLFGHPLHGAAASASIPVAYFDWTGGRARARKRDLPIDPRSSLQDVSATLRRWLLKS